MNTFLPFNNFKKCAKTLDDSRLWKQVLEGTQIIDIILKKNNLIPNESGKKGWWNHPVFKIWTDENGKFYLRHLVEYLDRHYDEFVFRNGSYSSYYETKRTIAVKMFLKNKKLFGQEDKNLSWSDEFHDIMKSNLIRKDRKHYEKFFGKGIRKKEGYLWENCKTC